MPLVGEVEKAHQGQAGPHLKPQVRNLWNQIEKGLYVKRQSGSRFGEVLEGGLTYLQRKFEPAGSAAKRDRVETELRPQSHGVSPADFS